MSNGGVSIVIKPPFRDIRGRFVKATAEMVNERREGMRHLGRRWVALAREEAPERKGGFKRSIAFRTFEQGNNVELRTYAAMPLGKWIREGTKPHIIEAKNKKALKFLWEAGPLSSGTFTGFHFYKSVHHPGTKPNPYHERAYARWKPEAHNELRRLAARWVERVM